MGQTNSFAYVGRDVHKAPFSVAVAKDGRGGEVRHVGVLPNRPEQLAKLFERLGRGGRQESRCYEVGPCGYGLHRQLSELGHGCLVLAPSLIPMKSGDRMTTDLQRDNQDGNRIASFAIVPERNGTHFVSRVTLTRYRTVRSKGALSQNTTKPMLFKLVHAAAKIWRRFKGASQVPRGIEGVTFIDGIASPRDRNPRRLITPRHPESGQLPLRFSIDGGLGSSVQIGCPRRQTDTDR